MMAWGDPVSRECPSCGSHSALAAEKCLNCGISFEGPRVSRTALAIQYGDTGKREAEIRLAMKRWLESATFEVWDTEQNRPTRVTEGLSDLIAFGFGLTLFVEVKTPHGRQSKAQGVFEGAVGRGGPSSHYLMPRSLDELQAQVRPLIPPPAVPVGQQLEF